MHLIQKSAQDGHRLKSETVYEAMELYGKHMRKSLGLRGGKHSYTWQHGKLDYNKNAVFLCQRPY